MDPNKGKKGLFNKFGKFELEKKLQAENFKRVTVSFYRYVNINDPYSFRDILYKEWNELYCLGRIYIAKEGINAQMSIPEYHWRNFTNLIHKHSYLKDIPFKIAIEDDGKSFYKLQIKVRKKIVADGLNDNEYDTSNVGTHLNAAEWNNALDNGAISVDIRNFYESEIGHFNGAILPKASTFTEELPEVLKTLKGYENDKILLYCTGGVRCEKTSAYLKHHGFKDVNQLHGGIIDYTRQVNAAGIENKFIGKNFVFDNRISERVTSDVISHCHQCGEACDTHSNCANVKCNLLFIQCDKCKSKFNGTCSNDCHEYILASKEKKQELSSLKNYKPVKRFFSKHSS
ncbi:rhodanese-related sulfurtransferase [Labilibacter sediminis]|nr:rhodanese-related sulfurtransferase [Labilibacter sediminis]